ncbi:putative membrane protein [Asticcacaulis biprosthecium C19]|uniref:Putative membrane protein n=1 Tax=Asticcacaulis biprosthecium C19 TaxID=715226 RepID=F4QTT6_9CAUL|nr:hypothetical protein [Asticcacaulis biprosthecium]EGF89236.1 putative membrane protein [Asticcacaulis biprosthecium C19]
MTGKGRLRTVIAGGLVAGALDIVDAFVFWAWKADVPAMRIGQSIAGGLLGEAASRGGWATFSLGMVAHFAMTVVMALAFYAVARLAPVVARHGLAFGAVYGAMVYAIMTYLVVPLSLATVGQNPHYPPNIDLVFINAIFAHVVLVGMVIGYFTKRAIR